MLTAAADATGPGRQLDPLGLRHQAEVLWRFADAQRDQVDVRLGGGDQVYRLKAEPGASGALYSDGMLAFHTKGEEGLVYWVATNDLIGRGCKAP